MQTMSLANVFIMLYFFIQDDVMDSPEVQADWNEQLALSNLFYLLFLDLYRQEFPPDLAILGVLQHLYNRVGC